MIKRRDFIKMGLGSLGAIALGPGLDVSEALGHSKTIRPRRTLRLTFTDAMVEMINLEQVYMWTFGDEENRPHYPGPTLFAREGDAFRVTLTNHLDEDHAFAISGTKINSGPIGPGQTKQMHLVAPKAGTYLYYDPLNAPVNRVLGLHGPMIVLPRITNTPYSDPTPNVQQLFNDLGTTAHFPGSPWDPARNFIWLFHDTDPTFNALAQPEGAPPINRILFKSQYSPRYFTIGGKSGHFVAHDHDISPHGHVGQPAMIRLLNAGLTTPSPHIHGNHIYVTSINGTVQRNLHYVDTFGLRSMDRVDWLVPFIRPPDIPPVADILNSGSNPNQYIRLDAAEELAYEDPFGLPQKPLAYPMHDHTEQSQTSNGGNYNTGTLVHLVFHGDRDGVEF